MQSSFSELLEAQAFTLAVSAAENKDDVEIIRAGFTALLSALEPAQSALRRATISCLTAASREVNSDTWLAQVVERFSRLQELASSSPEPAAAAESASITRRLGLPDWVDDELLRDFLSTQKHALDELEGTLLELEKSELVDLRLLRGKLHTMKGESGTVGLDDLQQLYHTWEDLLDDDVDLMPAIEPMLQAQDWVLSALESYAVGAQPQPPVSEMIALLQSAGVAQSTFAQPMVAEPIERDEESIALFCEFYDESIDGIAVTDDLLLQAENDSLEPDGINAIFRVFHTIKGVAAFVDQETIAKLAHSTENLLIEIREGRAALKGRRLDLVFEATGLMRRMLNEAQQAFANSLTVVPPPELAPLISALGKAVNGELQATEPEAAPPLRAPPEAPGPTAITPDKPKAPRSRLKSPTALRETIKVDLSRVDSLVELIGELVIVETMVANAPELLGLRSHRVHNLMSQLNKIIRDLQRQGLGLRMVPLKGVFQKMSRLVRDLSKRSGKKVNFNISGETTEMDRSLVEQVGDPLVHMVRNAMDHGLESEADRIAAGKPAAGTLTLSAYHEGGNIVISIRDDGRGLDREKLIAKAVRRGILTPAAGADLSDHEAYELIFAPGFSTAEQVTEISGRGVGMDVVKRAIDAMRGRIRIDSKLGEGTDFQLVLPLTLAIIDGMLLSCGSSRYVLPTLAIIESVQPRPGMIRHYADRNSVLNIRGELMPLIHLGETLGEHDASCDPLESRVIIIEGVRGRYGLMVDEVLGQQQVVIKNLGSELNSSGLFAGAAILANGRVGLILNPASLYTQGRGLISAVSLNEVAVAQGMMF